MTIMTITCNNPHHDATGRGICTFCVGKEVADAIKAERERCAKLVDDWAKAYPVSIFGNPEQGKHGPTVDSCSAKALRLTLPQVAEAIRGNELDSTETGLCRQSVRYDGGPIYCYQPLPCQIHGSESRKETK